MPRFVVHALCLSYHTLHDAWAVSFCQHKYILLILQFQQYVGTVKRTSSDNKIILLVNKADKGIVKQGSSLDIQLGGRYTGSTEPTATADIVDLSFDSQVVPTVVDSKRDNLESSSIVQFKN